MRLSTNGVFFSLLVLFAVLISLPALRGNYFYDDKILFVEHLNFKNGNLFQKLIDIGSPWGRKDMFRPLGMLTLYLNWLLAPDKPWVLRLGNVFLAAVIAFLFWRLLVYHFPQVDENLLFLFSLLFLVLPHNNQVFFYITARFTLLFSFFYLLAFFLYIKKKTVLCSLMFFLGLISKEEMISLPIVLFLYELLTFRNFKYYLKTLISFLPPIAFYGLLRFWVLGTLFWEKRFLGGFQFLLQQMGFFWTNFWLSLSEPVVFHDLRVFPWVIIYPFLLISFAIGVYCLWQRKPLGFIFLYPYILILSFAPVLNKHFLGMEYRLFLSNSFFILLLFLSLQKFALDIRLQRFLLLIIILGASLVSIYRACIYANTLSLWENTVTRYPNVSWARVNYGKELEERGLYQKAIEEWEQALRMNPQDFLAHYNLGVALGTVGKFTEALDEFKKAAKLTPSFAPAHYNLGLTYLILGDKIKAQEEFDKARELGWEVKVPEIKDGKN